MDIVFNKLYKIDIASNEVIEKPEYQNLDNFKKYIQNILEYISTKLPDRYYNFKSEYTEVRNLINNILFNNEYDVSCKSISNRLLDKEKIAQESLNKKKLKIDIQKGMLIVSLVRMTDEAKKLIILKVDYDEFISEITGEIVTGLSIRRQVYKSFICELNNENEIINRSVFDSNHSVSVYWWKEFLELDVVITDEENTKNAFDAIEKDILLPIKKKHKQDYLLLWNTSVAYFRSEGEFNLSHYREEIIGKYIPFDESIDINDLKIKVDKLSAKYKFDQRFDKVPSEIHKRFKNTLNLTPEIDLILKHDVANPKKTFKSYEDVDGKYLMIRSDEGYKYAEKIKQENVNHNE
jgi:hypothetical protein